MVMSLSLMPLGSPDIFFTSVDLTANPTPASCLSWLGMDARGNSFPSYGSSMTACKQESKTTASHRNPFMPPTSQTRMRPGSRPLQPHVLGYTDRCLQRRRHGSLYSIPDWWKAVRPQVASSKNQGSHRHHQ